MMWGDPVRLMARMGFRAFKTTRGGWNQTTSLPALLRSPQAGLSQPSCLPPLSFSVYNPRIELF